MAIGDEVHYLWRGSLSGDVDDWITVTTFTLNQPVVFDVYPEDISGNENGTVQASYWVVHAGSGRRSDSDVLTFRVGQPVVLDPPVISSIKDSKGQEIPNGGTTSDTSVTLSGTAAASQGVEVFDGSASKGKPTANASGQWTLAMTGLAVAAHAIKAKALYGDETESPVRTFNVSANTLFPTITSIKDSSGREIPDGGNTSDRILTFAGTAYPNSEVTLYDAPTVQGNGELVGTVWADAGGQWVVRLTIPDRSLHFVWILSNRIPSPVRRFTLT
jgi:hypothetical protein